MIYQRNLPHLLPTNTPLFITWRLFGSLSVEAQARIQETERTGGKRFAEVDRELQRSTGPHWLAKPTVADAVTSRIIRHSEVLQHYRLHAFVVMSNHVHFLITPQVSVARLMNTLKTRTARTANEILGRTGKPFWQFESFDRWCRDEYEFELVRRYIESNPVKAGLVKNAEEWPWSSRGIACRAGCLATSTIAKNAAAADGPPKQAK